MNERLRKVWSAISSDVDAYRSWCWLRGNPGGWDKRGLVYANEGLRDAVAGRERAPVHASLEASQCYSLGFELGCDMVLGLQRNRGQPIMTLQVDDLGIIAGELSGAFESWPELGPLEGDAIAWTWFVGARGSEQARSAAAAHNLAVERRRRLMEIMDG